MLKHVALLADLGFGPRFSDCRDLPSAMHYFGGLQ